MTIHRRGLFGAAGLAGALAGTVSAQAQTADRPASALEARLAALAAQSRRTIRLQDGRPTGDGWDHLLAEARAARFLLLGEEHGIAEHPKLAAALFAAAGFSRLVIEVSAPMADILDASAAQGLAGLRTQFADRGANAAFFGLQEEAEMLVAVRQAAGKPVLWGVDYEVAGDRRLVAELAAAKKPPAASAALAALQAAQAQAWAKYDASHNPGFIFTFSGDPALVAAAKAAWPSPDPHSAWILDTLEQTLAINAPIARGQGWESNRRRSDFLRANLLRHWRAAGPHKPRVMAKMGASHLIRGRSTVETYDLGSLIHELAAIDGGQALSVMVLPGAGAKAAVFDPSRWTYGAGPPKDAYDTGLSAIIAQAPPEGFSLFDLRPLRPLVWGRAERDLDPELVRAVHGFDMLLVMTGSTPSSNL